MYVADVYDIDWRDGSFKASFWLWYNYDNPLINPQQHTDFIDASDIISLAKNPPQKVPGGWRASNKYDATFHHDWDLRTYPFVKQNLEIIVENTEHDLGSLIFAPDKRNSRIDPNIKLGEWSVSDFSIDSSVKKYVTNFGDVRLPDESDYSRIVAKMHIHRTGMRTFFQLFGVMYLAYLLSFCVYFIPTQEMSSKMALLAGSIFAAIGNKFVIDRYLPPVTGMALSDKLQMMTFSFFLITVIAIVFSANLRRKGLDILARRVEISMAFISIFTYILLNFYLVSRAV